MSMIGLNAQSEAMLKLVVSVTDLDDLCVSIKTNKHSNLVLLGVWLPHKMEEVIGSGHNLGGLSNDHITGILNMEDFIEVSNISLNKSVCTG